MLRTLIISLAILRGIGNAAAQPARHDSVAALRLPAIPDTLKSAPERAAYLIAHFWDNMDFADTTLSTNVKFMEQNFANYASLFPHADISSVLPTAAKELMKRAESNRNAYNLLAETADTYLYEPESPVANEGAYMYFLQAITGSPFIDSALRARYEIQLEDVMKNRPGTQATDFEIMLRDGTTTTLLQKCKGGRATILDFYDPECENCSRLVEEMRRDPDLNKSVEQGHLNIIAVYPDGDMEEFEKAEGKIPAGWTDGISPDGKISEDELYSMPTFPTLYLIGADGKVIIKNGNPADIINTALAL